MRDFTARILLEEGSNMKTIHKKLQELIVEWDSLYREIFSSIKKENLCLPLKFM